MPALGQGNLHHGRIGRRHQIAVVIDVRNTEDLGRRAGLDDVLMVYFKITELPSEGDLLFIAQGLAGQDQHQVLHPGLMQCRKGFRRQGFGQINTRDLGAKRRV